MYQALRDLIRTRGARVALTREAPALIGAFVIAELFYKFHSFALECVAFLATWWLLSCFTWLIAGDGRRQDTPTA